MGSGPDNHNHHAKQPVSTVTLDPQLKSGQKTLAEARADPLQQPAPAGGGDGDQGAGNHFAAEGPNNSVKAKHNVLLTNTNAKPAYPGAKHDVRGFCVKHSRWRMVRPVSGEEGGSDPNNYRTVRKVCPVCGEQSLVKKERKTPSHGFNPYANRGDRDEQHDRRDKRDGDNGKLFTKVVPKSKSQAGKTPHFVRKRLHRANSAGTTASVDKNVEKERQKSSDVGASRNNTKSSTKVESDESLQRRRSHSGPIRQEGGQNHNRDNGAKLPDKKETLQKQKSKDFDEHAKESGTRQDKKDGLQRQKSQSAGQHEKRDESLQRQKSPDRALQQKKREDDQKEKSQSSNCQEENKEANRGSQEHKTDDERRRKSKGAVCQEENGNDDRGSQQDKKENDRKKSQANRQGEHEDNNRGLQQERKEQAQRQKNKSAKAKEKDEGPKHKEYRDEVHRQKWHKERKAAGRSHEKKDGIHKQKSQSAMCQEGKDEELESQQKKKDTSPKPQSTGDGQNTEDEPMIRKCRSAEGTRVDKNDEVVPRPKSKSAVRQGGRKEDEYHDGGDSKEKKVGFQRQKSRNVVSQDENIDKENKNHCKSGDNDEHKNKGKSSSRQSQHYTAIGNSNETTHETESNPVKGSISEENVEIKHSKAVIKKEMKLSFTEPSLPELKRGPSKDYNQKSPEHSIEKSEAVVIKSRSQNHVEKKSHSRKHDTCTKKSVELNSDMQDITKHTLAHVTRSIDNKTSSKARGRSLSPHRTSTRKVKTIDAKIEEGRNDPTRLKQRSKSVGHTIRTQRQRIGSRFHYIHQPAITFMPIAPAPAPAATITRPAVTTIPETPAAPPVPATSISAYRVAFYEEIENRSCVKSLQNH